MENACLKNKKRILKKHGGKARLAFEIAECYYQNKDTLYIKWFNFAAEQYKKDYSKEKDKSKKATQLFAIGKCYYYLEYYPKAEAYFHKSIKAKYPDPIAFYYLGDCLKKQNKCQEAIVEFSNFKKLCANCLDADEMIDKCLIEMEKQK